jgi:hypothetical protein
MGSTESLSRIAHHEAGHAVIGDAVGLKIHLVELFDAGQHVVGGPNGRVVTAELEHFRNIQPEEGLQHDDSFREFLEKDLVQRMAGVVADLRLCGADIHDLSLPQFEGARGAAGDFWAAWRHATAIARHESGPAAKVSECQRLAETMLIAALRRASSLVDENWHLIERVASELRQRRTLNGLEFRALLRLARAQSL